MARPTTAVIGAGISGLTTSKMLDDYGVPFTTFESSDRVGGNWAFGNPNGHSSAYRSLHIDTSKYQLSFRDFPMPDEYPDFPHHTLIKDYLDAYTDVFGLREKIEFQNGVVRAERLSGWKIDRAFVGVGGQHVESLNSPGQVAVTGHHREVSREDVNRAVEARVGDARDVLLREARHTTRLGADGRLVRRHHFPHLPMGRTASVGRFADAWPDLEALDVPILLVRGDRGYVSPKLHAGFAERLPLARIVTVESRHAV